MTLPLIPLPRTIRTAPGEPIDLRGAPVYLPRELFPAATTMLRLPAQQLIENDSVPGETSALAALADQAKVSPAVILVEEAGDGEAYVLDASSPVIELRGNKTALVRALATLAQLRDLESDSAPTGFVPPVVIEDEPRFGLRGLMIDVARHFFPPATIKRILDVMAWYKFTALHLHLSDDQGWRIEIPARAELTEKSSASQVGEGAGGYFTTADYEQIVAYAAERGIEVIPEIDMPGHVNAAQHAIAALNEDGRATDIYTGIEVGFSKLSLANEATAPFIADVLSHLAAITPGEYLHVGGDEVHQMERDEYAEFVEYLAKAAMGAGKKPQLWGETAVGKLPAGTRLQMWDSNADPAPIAHAAKAGARVVLSPGNKVYLDMQYHEGYEFGLHWAGYVELRDSYDWDPATHIPGLPPEAIDGVAAALWTETLSEDDHIFTMLLPRLAAVAEVAWSKQEARSWEEFRLRVREHGPWWSGASLAYYPSGQAFE